LIIVFSFLAMPDLSNPMIDPVPFSSVSDAQQRLRSS